MVIPVVRCLRYGSIVSRQAFHGLLISINLVHRELMRTYKKSRIGFGVILLPAIAGSFFAIGISSARPEGTNQSHLYQVLFWLFLIDVGSYPLRLYKRIRPLILLLDPSLLSLAAASALRSMVLGLLRMLPLVVLNLFGGGSHHWHMQLLSNLLISPFVSLVLGLSVVSLIAFLFGLGILAAAFYLSFMEINQFLPPSLGLLGYVSGYFPISRPSFISALDAYNPLAMIRVGLFDSSSVLVDTATQPLIAAVILVGLSLILSLTGDHLVNRLMRIR